MRSFLFKISVSLVAISAVFSLANAPVFAQEEVNAGFVGGIWFSSDPFFAGDDVRVYAAIQNQSGLDLIGTVQFFDNDNLISESDFSIISGGLIGVWTDWKVAEGEHSFYGKIVSANKSEVGEDPVLITLKFGDSGVSQRIADIDTDGDKIGNAKDPDDDNDGISDEEEIRLGTDPLIPDIREDSVDDENKTSSTTIQKIIEMAKKGTDLVGSKTKSITEKIAKNLEEKRDKIKEEIRVAGNISNEGEEDLPADEKKKVSMWKKAYVWLLSALIFVLNTWWLSLIVIVLIFRTLWKLTSRWRFRKSD